MQPLWKTVWRFLKTLKIDLPYDPAVAMLGIYPRDTGVLSHRGTCTPMFIAALSTIAKLWKEPKCPSTDKWIKKLWFIYTMEYYVAMRKNEINIMLGITVMSNISFFEISVNIILRRACFHSYVDPEKLTRRPWGGEGKKKG